MIISPISPPAKCPDCQELVEDVKEPKGHLGTCPVVARKMIREAIADVVPKIIAEHMSYLSPNAFAGVYSVRVVLATTGQNAVNQVGLRVGLHDGRSLFVPVASFKRLANASVAQLENFEIIGMGQGVHWPDLDEDISVRGFLRHGTFYVGASEMLEEPKLEKEKEEEKSESNDVDVLLVKRAAGALYEARHRLLHVMESVHGLDVGIELTGIVAGLSHALEDILGPHVGSGPRKGAGKRGLVHCKRCRKTHSVTPEDDECSPGAWIEE